MTPIIFDYLSEISKNKDKPEGVSRHPLGCFSIFFLCPYSYYFAYFQEIIGIITKYTWTLPGSCSRRRIAVATFARLSTSISCMYVIFAHNDVPLSEGRMATVTVWVPHASRYQWCVPVVRIHAWKRPVATWISAHYSKNSWMNGLHDDDMD